MYCNHIESEVAPQGGNLGSVLLISHNLELEGAPLYLFNLANELQHISYRVSVVSLCNGPLYTQYKEAGFDIHICDEPACFINLMKLHTVSIINTLVMAPLVDFVSSHEQDVNIIWTIHESDRASYADLFPAVNEVNLFAYARYVVFVSCETAWTYNDVNTGNFAVIPGFTRANTAT